eukprot:comp12015_c0_seq1/m.15358 comp12015_c0_seq1/g.15358  ORF comp12015_c0_seq1/g.15358 comp12015_c0_seq1/m.15358 type:complete len:233 (-) comp12015_c0_seq1:283-981(-)
MPSLLAHRAPDAAADLAHFAPLLAQLRAKQRVRTWHIALIGAASHEEAAQIAAQQRATPGYASAFDGDVVVPHTAVPYSPELSCKWIFNAISTIAHVLKGTVFRNRMINVSISNQKLFFRALDMIIDLVQVPRDTALCALRHAILQSSSPSIPPSAYPDESLPIEQQIPGFLKLTEGRTGLLPLAMLIAERLKQPAAFDPQLEIPLMQKKISDQPIIRLLINDLAGTSTGAQ